MEFHFPGTNYLGPGTHVINRIMSGVEPTSYDDALALRHDIEYLADGEKHHSDYRAYSSASWSSLEGLALKFGLLGRSVIDKIAHFVGKEFHFNGRTDTSPISTKLLQAALLHVATPWLKTWGVAPTIVDD